jgi:hypothetical protein
MEEIEKRGSSGSDVNARSNLWAMVMSPAIRETSLFGWNLSSNKGRRQACQNISTPTSLSAKYRHDIGIWKNRLY